MPRDAAVAGLRMFGLLGLACLASLACLPSSAHAQRPPAQYQGLIDEALDEFERGHWDEAAGLFEQAHRLYPNARTLRGMGIAAFEGRRYVRALEHLGAALRSDVNPLTAEQRREIEGIVARAEHYVARLDITVVPADAEVRVNDATLPPSSGSRVIRLDPGLAQVRVSAPGHASHTREVRLVAGVRETLAFQLTPDATASLAPAAGPAREEPMSPPVDHPRSGVRFHAWKWVVLGAGALALTGGGISHAQREIAATDYNADPDCGVDESDPAAAKRCGALREDFDGATTRLTIGYIAGGVLVGAGILMFALESDGEAPSARATRCDVGIAAASCTLHF